MSSQYKMSWKNGAACTGLIFAAVVSGTSGWYPVRAETVSDSGGLSANSQFAPSSFADIFTRVSPAVVSIDATRSVDIRNGPDSQEISGLPFALPLLPDRAPDGKSADSGLKAHISASGFFISPDGYVLTNDHAVERATSITVTLNDKRVLPARIIGRDAGTDLAVLKVEGANFPSVTFEEGAQPRVGDWVLAIGNPLGLGGTATAGIISTKNRTLEGNDIPSKYVDYIQIDAPINQGNSGGPTFDTSGRVIGVNTAIYSENGGSIGIGFDIPAQVASEISKQLISDGRIVRGYIGVSIQDITPDIAGSLGLPAARGAMILDLVSGGPGDRGGLQQGDIILELDGHEIASGSDLTRRVAAARKGDLLQFVVRREGRRLKIEVRCGVQPAKFAGDNQNENGDEQREGARAATSPFGMVIEPITGVNRLNHHLGDGLSGLLVDRVADGSSAAEAGLKPGDVIMKVGSRPVSTVADVKQITADAKRSGWHNLFIFVHRGEINFGASLRLEP